MPAHALELEASPTAELGTEAAPLGCARALLTYAYVGIRRFCLALHFKAMICSVCALLEGTAGWVSGDAWTQACAVERT